MPTPPDHTLTAVLADDTEDIRLLLRMHLEADGRIAIVGEASNTAKALEILRRERPTLLVLDATLPGLAADGTIARLRDGNPDLKVLLLTDVAVRHLAGSDLGGAADAIIEKGSSFRVVTRALLDLAGLDDLEGERVVRRAAHILEDDAEASRPLDGETLLALIAHELRTPITVLTGLSARLSRSAADLDPELIASAATAVERNVRRLERLVASFSDLYALDRDDLALTKRAVQLSTFVRGVMAELQGFLEHRELNIDVGEGWLELDHVRIEQVLVNLVLNAARYSPAGTPIEVHAAVVDDSARIVVRDHGPGVAPADRQRIFRKFARDPEGGGTGLGLYLSLALAQAHGGSLVYEVPAEGEGASFVLTVPGVIASPPAVTTEAPVWG